MGRPRIKINVEKEISKVFLKICRELWKFQFSPEFTGPNQGAACENCLLYKNGDCVDWIPPEKCIEESAVGIFLEQLVKE